MFPMSAQDSAIASDCGSISASSTDRKTHPASFRSLKTFQWRSSQTIESSRTEDFACATLSLRGNGPYSSPGSQSDFDSYDHGCDCDCDSLSDYGSGSAVIGRDCDFASQTAPCDFPDLSGYAIACGSCSGCGCDCGSGSAATGFCFDSGCACDSDSDFANAIAAFDYGRASACRFGRGIDCGCGSG
jgi:hypothetical protein